MTQIIKRLIGQHYIGWIMVLVLVILTLVLAYLLPNYLTIAIFVSSFVGFTSVYVLSGIRVSQAARDAVSNSIMKAARLLSAPFQSANLVDEAHFAIIDALPIAGILIAPNGKISKSNKSAQSLLCLAEDEQPIFSDVVRALARPINEVLQQGKTKRGFGQPIMLTAKRAEPELFLQVSLSSLDISGLDYTIAVLNDATELKTLEAQFVQSQKMQAIGQLAGGVAHDFNNLLTAISGYCDLLKLRHERGDPDYSDLVQIENNANRAAALVGQLLAFSRKQTLQPKAVQVNDTLTDLTHLLNRLVGEKITLRLDQSNVLPLAYVDSRQLEQVIMNLVVNARDAMKNGGSIWIRTKSVVYQSDHKRDKVKLYAGQYVLIEVTDEGSGIAPEDIAKIFEPFFSTKKVGEGTGLGLSTAYGIIKQTGGYIFADSELGKGTTFSIFLPVVAPKEVKKDTVPEKRASNNTGLTGVRVLLVEDEDPVRAFASRALAMQGVELLQARSGEEALEIAQKNGHAIDVIISDVIMPGMNGPEWVRKAGECCKDTKIIFMSGYAEEVFDTENTSDKSYTFLPKPFSLKDLIATLSKSVDRD